MNIFFLSMSIRKCASYYFDKHVIKLIVEYTQLLSCAWHILDSPQAQIYLKEQKIYKPTHVNHPCSIWVRQHINNYLYVCQLGLQLCHEWRKRYKHQKIHACEPKLQFLLNHQPPMPTDVIQKNKYNPKGLLVPLPQSMPISYKSMRSSVCQTVKAYRRYYQSVEKQHIRQWKTNKPYWFTN